MARTLTPADFQAWLDDVPPGQTVVGTVGSDRHCPLAEYLQARGYVYAIVGPQIIVVNRRSNAGCNRYIKTPGWARRFINHIDYTGARPGSVVHVSDARHALAHALEDY